MASSSLMGEVLSPESTVTSLLSSSGHLRSSLRAPGRSTIFTYKDQEYHSASEALNAYIVDYERSGGNRGVLMGPLVLPCDRPPTTSKTRAGMLRNKDVLRERLTDGELDFLNLPVSSLHHRGNRDRLSMTTDELLSIPNDGSMPVTHTSAFIQDLLSQSGPSSTRPEPKSCAGLCRSCAASHHVSQHHSVLGQSCRRRAKLTVVKAAGDSPVSTSPGLPVHQCAHGAERPASLHLPAWSASRKSDMYPAWIHHCDVGGTPSELRDEPVGPPSWVSDLVKNDEPDGTSAQADQELSLRDLRLELAEEMSLLAAERRGTDALTALSSGNRMESLIQKADQVLSWLSLSAGGSDSHAHPVSGAPQSPANTEELLQHSAHHAALFSTDSSAGGLTADLTHTQVEAGGSGPDSRWKQPGPLEAVKQMLFRLQAVEAELHKQHADSPHTPEKQPGDDEGECLAFSGSPSLQRALHHLSRLKLLVEEPKHHREEEDEGRYSSSTADRLMCSLQDPE